MEEENETDNSKKLELWMIRPCEIYKNEYNECTSIVSRLHQMFVDGSTSDCNNWHEDYTNCLRWKSDKDIKAAEKLIQSEINKRNNRWKAHYANNIWENRMSPPENWNEPLPEYIEQRRVHSTLKDSIDEYSDGANSKSLCSIM